MISEASTLTTEPPTIYDTHVSGTDPSTSISRWLCVTSPIEEEAQGYAAAAPRSALHLSIIGMISHSAERRLPSPSTTMSRWPALMNPPFVRKENSPQPTPVFRTAKMGELRYSFGRGYWQESNVDLSEAGLCHPEGVVTWLEEVRCDQVWPLARSPASLP